MGSNNGKDGLSAVANSETETDAASAVTTTATAMMMKSMSSVRNNDEGDEEKILSTATITTIAQQSELSESNVARRTSIVQYDGGYAEATLNMILFDPPRWGWTAVGGVVDLLSPHERSRRRSTGLEYRKLYKRHPRQQHQHRRRSSNASRSIVTRGATEPSSWQQQTAYNDDEQSQKHPAQETATGTTRAVIQLKDPPPNSMDQQTQQQKLQADPTQTNLQPQQMEPKLPISDNIEFHGEGRLTTLTTRQTSLYIGPSLGTKEGGQPMEVSPGIDLGVKLVGIPSRTLGMTIERQKPQENDANVIGGDADNDQDKANDQDTAVGNKNNKKNSKKRTGGIPKYDCFVHSLGDIDSNGQDGVNKVLDMYSYHRGREGLEPRDAESGELLCAHEITDTNHDLDAPKLVVSVVVQFPLEDDDDDEKVCNSTKENTNNSTKCEKAVYRDVIDWDLLDPSTPSPLTFANSISREYGLSFGLALDLAASIEQQIEAHIAANCQYGEPISIKDPQGLSERPRQPRPTIQPFRYDQVIETGKGGYPKPTKLRLPSKSRSAVSSGQTSKANAGQMTSNFAGGTSSANSKRRGSTDSSTLAAVSDAIMEDNVENIYIDEVKKRSRAASILDVGRKCKNGVIGKLERKLDPHCHICHKRCKVGYGFACGIDNHVYCESHVKLRLEIVDDYVCDYCPICSLLCECAKCKRKITAVGKIFKAKCLEQDKNPSQTPFGDVLELCRQKQSSQMVEMSKAAASIIQRRKHDELESEKKRMAKKAAKLQEQATEETMQQRGQKVPTSHERKVNDSPVQQRTCQNKKQMMVPKPPISDFPREVYQGSEIEVATYQDYFTVFSAEGQRLVNSPPDAWLEDSATELNSASSLSKKETDLPEDGNVDYCHCCRAPGNLLCCDFCPRAFHLDCIKKEGHSASGKDGWECFVCIREKTGLDDDLVDGTVSMDLIMASFVTFDVSDEYFLSGISALSMIHEMITKLMKYDFGYVFSKPVDLATVPGYKEMVKRPMDLGTICSMLINGEYAKLLNEGRNTIDDVVARVLKDIELVWHNCFIFNFDGSSFFRMAEVLRRRADMIRLRSFNHKLSDRVKSDLEEYVRTSEKARAAMPKITQSTPLQIKQDVSDDAKEIALMNKKPRSRSKISLNVWNPKRSKIIAVLDNVSGRVVKTFGTSRSAAQAVQNLLDLGHPCEWNANLGLNVKLIAEKSGNDPAMLLFGYRWVFLEDLRAGKVAFFKPNVDVVEMRHKECTYVFQSAEEALSFSDLPKSLNLRDLRMKLGALPRSTSWYEIHGTKWRRPIMKDATKVGYIDKESKKLLNGKRAIQIESSTVSGSLSDAVLDSPDHLINCTIIKKDLVSDRYLVGFENVSLAHKDWTQTTIASPTFPESEPRTLGHFKKYYLDGDRNVDGIVWHTATGSNKNSGIPSLNNVSIANLPTGLMLGNTNFVSANAPPLQINLDAPMDTTTNVSRKRKHAEDEEDLVSPKEPRQTSTLDNNQNQEPNPTT